MFQGSRRVFRAPSARAHWRQSIVFQPVSDVYDGTLVEMTWNAITMNARQLVNNKQAGSLFYIALRMVERCLSKMFKFPCLFLARHSKANPTPIG
jgi:hypothetical protein